MAQVETLTRFVTTGRDSHPCQVEMILS